MKPLSRREFLKLSAMLPLGYFAHKLKATTPFKGSNQPNIMIVVFDAWTSKNIGFHGYQRETMPQLTRLLDRALVYHEHYANAPFTSSGTASLLTGTMPWTHRSFRFNGTPARAVRDHNIFKLFDSYNRIAYSHNPLANTLLYEFDQSIDNFVKREKLFLSEDRLASLFSRDYVIENLARQEALSNERKGRTTNSLLLSKLYARYSATKNDSLLAAYTDQFPGGLPGLIEDDAYFLLEDAVDWIIEQARIQENPYLGYYHLWPPHRPYRTRAEFSKTFVKDDFLDIKKPEHLFSMGFSERKLRLRRGGYDRTLLYIDAEFARLYESLSSSGALDNTWLILTADHGEMFERGLAGHFHSTLHDPVVRVPLVIFPPGQQERVDVHTPTSAIDLLPTLLQVTGQSAPDWLEGQVLPEFTDAPVDEERPIFTFDAKQNGKLAPLSVFTATIRVGNNKLIYYTGYKELRNEEFQNEYMELYDVVNDPEEMEDLSASQPDLLKDLRKQLLDKVAEKDAPYRR